MIKRFFTDFSRIKNDFDFLVKIINNTNGEFDFAIREDYFSIYYKGNSLAKVEIKKERYRVSIHKNFFEGSIVSNKFKGTQSNVYYVIELYKEKLHSFFQVKHLKNLASKIKQENNGEEITFEQAIITDNRNREELIIIDRQITETQLKRKRLDLLALKQVKDNKYQFLILEVKLGNNPELKDEVENQLDGYINHIKTNFKDYKQCYEKNYLQKKGLALIETPNFSEIEIVDPVDGMIIIGGYSGIAESHVERLKSTGFKVKQFKYEI